MRCNNINQNNYNYNKNKCKMRYNKKKIYVKYLIKLLDQEKLLQYFNKYLNMIKKKKYYF